MLQFFFEIIVAVLAVYGGYTALQELAALICKWIGAPAYSAELPQDKGKEDSCREGGEENDELGRSNDKRSGDDIGGSGTSSAGRDD
jgi:hypothetical protein